MSNMDKLKLPIKREPELVLKPTGEYVNVLGKRYRVLEMVRVNEKGVVIS